MLLLHIRYTTSRLTRIGTARAKLRAAVVNFAAVPDRKLCWYIAWWSSSAMTRQFSGRRSETCLHTREHSAFFKTSDNSNERNSSNNGIKRNCLRGALQVVSTLLFKTWNRVLSCIKVHAFVCPIKPIGEVLFDSSATMFPFKTPPRIKELARATIELLKRTNGKALGKLLMSPENLFENLLVRRLISSGYVMFTSCLLFEDVFFKFFQGTIFE